MPAKSFKNQLPAASKRKRFLHAFYLAQPFLQFFALMAVMIILSRCSPLASSVDRTYGSGSALGGLQAGPAENAQTIVKEELVRKSMKEITDASELKIVSEAAFTQATRDTLRADDSIDLSQVKSVFDRRIKTTDFRRPNILEIPLSAEQRNHLFQEGSLRIDLSDRLKTSMDTKTRSFFFEELAESEKQLDLGAELFLVSSELAPQSANSKTDLSVHLKISLAIIGSDLAFLDIARTEEHPSDAQQEQLKAQLSQAQSLAVVLE
jgi:hypothetical protein